MALLSINPSWQLDDKIQNYLNAFLSLIFIFNTLVQIIVLFYSKKSFQVILWRKIDTGIKMNNKQTNIKGAFVSFTIIYMMPITIRAVTSDLITACFVINMTKKFPT